MENNQFNKKSLFIATPMYGGVAHNSFITSMISLTSEATRNDIFWEFVSVTNESLVTRARNVLVHIFLKSKAKYLLFIDADIGFNHLDVFHMLNIASKETGKDVIAALYPQKVINWEQIDSAIYQGKITSLKDYEDYSGIYGFDPVQEMPDTDGSAIEALRVSTGFMMINRDVFEKFMIKYPKKCYFDREINEKVFTFFESGIMDDDYLSEDYMFCYYARELGFKVWALPKIPLTHSGSFIFSGKYSSTYALNKSINDKKQKDN